MTAAPRAGEPGRGAEEGNHMHDLDAIVRILESIQLKITIITVMAGFLFGAEAARLFAAYAKSRE
jgi:hypothetical protein